VRFATFETTTSIKAWYNFDLSPFQVTVTTWYILRIGNLNLKLHGAQLLNPIDNAGKPVCFSP